jgi:hypothetical protein
MRQQDVYVVALLGALIGFIISGTEGAVLGALIGFVIGNHLRGR